MIELHPIDETILSLARPLLIQGRWWDLWHTELALDHMRLIIESENLHSSADVLIPAIILHDIGWSALTSEKHTGWNTPHARAEHMRFGVELARSILINVEYPYDLIDKIVDLVATHDNWSLGSMPSSPSEHAIRDADACFIFTYHSFWKDYHVARLADPELTPATLLHVHQEKFASRFYPTAQHITDQNIADRLAEINSSSKSPDEHFETAYRALLTRNSVVTKLDEVKPMHIFISYSRVDRPLVQELVTDLEALGHNVWFDQAIDVGSEWQNEIFKNILNCDLLIIALGLHTLTSAFCAAEWRYAKALKKRMLPVAIGNPQQINSLLASSLSTKFVDYLTKTQFVDYSYSDRNRIRTLSMAIRSLPPGERLPFPLPELDMPELEIEQIDFLEGHHGRLESAIFSSRGDHIASTCWGELAIVWDSGPPNYQEKFRLRHKETVTHASFHPDGRYLLTSCWDGTVYIWDIGSEEHKLINQCRVHDRRVLSAEFSPDGATFVTTSRDTTVRIWDFAQCIQDSTPSCQKELTKHTLIVKTGSFSPDGCWLVTCAYEEAGEAGGQGEVYVWDVDTGACVRKLVGHQSGVYTARFNPKDSTQVLTASRDKTARVWHTELTPGDQEFREVEPQFSLDAHPDRVYCAAYSPDGKLIITGCADGFSRLWDAQTQNQLFRLAGHTNVVIDVNFSLDGVYLVTASWDFRVGVWDIDQSLKALVKNT